MILEDALEKGYYLFRRNWWIAAIPIFRYLLYLFLLLPAGVLAFSAAFTPFQFLKAAGLMLAGLLFFTGYLAVKSFINAGFIGLCLDLSGGGSCSKDSFISWIRFRGVKLFLVEALASLVFFAPLLLFLPAIAAGLSKNPSLTASAAIAGFAFAIPLWLIIRLALKPLRYLAVAGDLDVADTFTQSINFLKRHPTAVAVLATAPSIAGLFLNALTTIIAGPLTKIMDVSSHISFAGAEYAQVLAGAATIFTGVIAGFLTSTILETLTNLWWTSYLKPSS